MRTFRHPARYETQIYAIKQTAMIVFLVGLGWILGNELGPLKSPEGWLYPEQFCYDTKGTAVKDSVWCTNQNAIQACLDTKSDDTLSNLQSVQGEGGITDTDVQ
jgi:hypothetical protein